MDFGATNKPGTCLWCGKKLRQKYHTTWKHTDKKPQACGGTINDGTWDKKRCGGKDIKKNKAGNWACSDCHWETSGRKEVESRVPAHELLGEYGDGCFCNKTHGYMFAVRAARNGFRLRPKQPLNEYEKHVINQVLSAVEATQTMSVKK